MKERWMEIGELWRWVNREIHERYRRVFTGSDLAPMAYYLLHQIARDPGITVSGLTKCTGTAKSHVSKLVDQLATYGYVEKRTDAADQRLLRMYTTPDAAERMAEWAVLAEKTWAQLLEDVPETQQDEVIRGLRILQEVLTNKRSKTP